MGSTKHAWGGGGVQTAVVFERRWVRRFQKKDIGEAVGVEKDVSSSDKDDCIERERGRGRGREGGHGGQG